MLKALLFIAITLPSTALASGKLSFEPRYNQDTGQATYIVGLGIYEKLMRGVAFNSWTGFGDAALEGDDSNYSLWSVSKNQIDLQYKQLTVSPGVRLSYVPSVEKYGKGLQSEVLVKFTYELW